MNWLQRIDRLHKVTCGRNELTFLTDSDIDDNGDFVFVYAEDQNGKQFKICWPIDPHTGEIYGLKKFTIDEGEQ